MPRKNPRPAAKKRAAKLQAKVEQARARFSKGIAPMMRDPRIMDEQSFRRLELSAHYRALDVIPIIFEGSTR